MHRPKTIALIVGLAGFMACGDPVVPVEKNDPALLEQGKAISAASFSALSGQLQSQMKAGGVPAALEYCNIQALPLTDSLSNAHNAEIKRTSLKLRNPKNKPTADELSVLQQFEALIEQGKKPEAIVLTGSDNKSHFYSPIFANAVCLNCHGTPGEEIETSNYALIRELYPEDQATAYSSGDWRGIWSITFNQ